jgi:hypothetical protein
MYVLMVMCDVYVWLRGVLMQVSLSKCLNIFHLLRSIFPILLFFTGGGDIALLLFIIIFYVRGARSLALY